MTIYEHLESRAAYCEEQCREARDGWMRSFWARTADQFYKMARRLTAEEAAEEYRQ